jgi:glucose-1-phosphate thymidylyltransferase
MEASSRKALLLARGSGVAPRPDRGSRFGRTPAMPSLATMMVGNRTLFEHQLDWLSTGGFDRIGIACDIGVRSVVEDLLARQNSRRAFVKILERAPGDGLASVMLTARDFLGDDPFLLHLGDGLIRPAATDVIGAASGDELDAVVVLADPNDALRPSLHAQHAGVYRLGRGFASALGTVDPSSLEDEIRDAISGMRDHGGDCSLVSARSWRWRGDGDAMLSANRFLLEGLRPSVIPQLARDCAIDGAVRVPHSAKLTRCVVRGPAIIGAGASLVDTYIGPYTTIGDGARIAGARIQDAVVLPGTSIERSEAPIATRVVGEAATPATRPMARLALG